MGKERINLAVFISGRGSNLQSILDACAADNFPAQVGVVISNRADAFGLERAKKAGIATHVVNHKDFDTRAAFEEELLRVLSAHDIDLICLAGFMRILTPVFTSQWDGRFINIHPSLLPDYKGLNTHARVLEDGRNESGCTVHYVVPELDSGPIILQKRVAVLDGDTPDTLAARVLEQEHIAYPEAIKIVAAKIG